MENEKINTQQSLNTVNKLLLIFLRKDGFILMLMKMYLCRL